jgi:hypothetical protein
MLRLQRANNVHCVRERQRLDNFAGIILGINSVAQVQHARVLDLTAHHVSYVCDNSLL